MDEKEEELFPEEKEKGAGRDGADCGRRPAHCGGRVFILEDAPLKKPAGAVNDRKDESDCIRIIP